VVVEGTPEKPSHPCRQAVMTTEEFETMATKHYITISEIMHLAARLENRGSSVVLNDQPETQSDMRLAAALLRQLSKPTTPWAVEIENGRLN
jgi:hypothetical protein